MNVKDELMKHIWNLPFIPTYLYGNFFVSRYPDENITRYGALFVDPHRPRFLLLIEVFDTPPQLSAHNHEKMEGKKVYYDYVPSFPMIKDILRGKPRDNLGLASWMDKNKIFTVVSVKRDEDVKPYVKDVLESRNTVIREDLIPLFEKYRFLPESANEWKLVTIFFWFTDIRDERGISHRIIHVQGNYKKQTNFLNVELRFCCPCPECLPGLKVVNLKNEGEITIREKRVKRGMNPAEELFLVHINKEKRFSIICHDNATNTSRDEESINILMSKAIELLEFYYPEFLSQRFMMNLV